MYDWNRLPEPSAASETTSTRRAVYDVYEDLAKRVCTLRDDDDGNVLSAFTGSEDTRFLNRAIKLVNREGKLAIDAIDALAGTRDSTARMVLASLATLIPLDTGYVGVAAMSAMRDNPTSGLRSLAPTLLRDNRVEVIAIALSWLKNAASTEEVGLLVEMLRDPSLEIRRRSVLALSGNHRSGLVPVLTRMATNESENPGVRMLALGVIGESREPEATELLRGLVGRPELGASALRALGRHDSDVTFRLLVKHTNSSDDAMRLSATEGLTFQSSKAKLPALLRMLNDGHEMIRAAAIEGLSTIDDVRARAAVIHRLTDESREVRTAAIQASREFENDDSRAAISGFLWHSDPKTRAAAVCALDFDSRPWVAGAAAELVANRSVPVEIRCRMAQSFRGSRNVTVTAALTQVLSDRAECSSVRSSAALGLSGNADQSATEALTLNLADIDGAVADACAEAIASVPLAGAAAVKAATSRLTSTISSREARILNRMFRSTGLIGTRDF